ncbi:hypothetical protein FQA39_LY10165 [Lamprigera yunnana]|nr:hypothetical protein FQA39_LY10165 [Lamprigera yunnana]
MLWLLEHDDSDVDNVETNLADSDDNEDYLSEQEEIPDEIFQEESDTISQNSNEGLNVLEMQSCDSPVYVSKNAMKLSKIPRNLQACDMMWKPRQIGSKTLTFELIQKNKILRIEDMGGNKVYLGIQFIKRDVDVVFRTALDPLYEKLGALEFDADHEAVYGMERNYTVQQCEQLRDKYKIGRKNSESDTSSSSDEEECNTVEQNGEGLKTTEEEETKKSEGEIITKPVS